MSISPQFKKALASLRRRSRFVFPHEAPAFARSIEALFEKAADSISNPRDGVAFADEFFRGDEAIFHYCDDSDGIIGDVFRIHARDLFVRFAKECEDKHWVAKKLLDLQRDDGFGVRSAVMEMASEFLSEEFIRSLIAQMWNLADNDATEYGRKHWLHLVESLARQIHDAPLFQKALLTAWPGGGTAGFLNIAEVYHECGDAQAALSWLQRVPLSERFMEGERDRLLLSVHSALGNRTEVAETTWRIFRRHRHEDTLALLLDALAPVDRDQLITDEISLIMQSAALSYTDAAFLISLDRIKEASAYLLKHAESLNGDDYYALLPLAETLEEGRMYLASSMLYRALLESILSRGISKYYTHGVRYLRKLDVLASRVTHWERFVPHGIYHLNLLEQHPRKSSFWQRYLLPEGQRYRKRPR